MLLALLLVIGGPAETIAGKTIRHSAEFLDMYPAPAIEVPKVLPTEVDALCRLIEKAGPRADFFAALGDALVEAGRHGLAYRAYDRAQRLGYEGDLQRKKDKLEPVPDSVIEAEEREAKAWVLGLQEYERERIRRGEDPRDLGPFYERYGRPEESLARYVRIRQTAFWVAALGTVLVFFMLRRNPVLRLTAKLPSKRSSQRKDEWIIPKGWKTFSQARRLKSLPDISSRTNCKSL